MPAAGGGHALSSTPGAMPAAAVSSTLNGLTLCDGTALFGGGCLGGVDLCNFSAAALSDFRNGTFSHGSTYSYYDGICQQNVMADVNYVKVCG